MLEDFFFKPSNQEDSLNPAYKAQHPNFYNLSDAMILYTSGTTGPPKGELT